MLSKNNLFSLQKFLEKTDIPKTTISKVMNSSNPFGEAKNLFNGLKKSRMVRYVLA